MARSEFPVAVRTAAWKRCKGRCEQCTAKLYPGKFQYDHIRADGLGGLPTLLNCQVLCSACHSPKTHEHDRPIMAKADRMTKKQVLPRKPSTFPRHRDPWGKNRGGNVKVINE